MKDPLKLALTVALLVFGLSAAALYFISINRPSPSPSPGNSDAATSASGDQALPDEKAVGLVLLPFSMTAQDGSTVTNDALKGKVTILDFTFTRCSLICPRMTGVLFELQDQIKSPKVQFLSISVDPEHDTPQVLAEHAKNFGATAPRWRFLAGEKKKVYSLLTDGLKFGIRENPPLKQPDGTTVPDINHPAHFFLIGPAGEVLGYYDSNDDQAVATLKKRVEQIAARLPG